MIILRQSLIIPGICSIAVDNWMVSAKMSIEYCEKEVLNMPTISMFRGIKVFMNWNEHQPPHFHAVYGGDEVLVGINNLDVIEG